MTILAVGPHPDDVELGCFGTLARLAAQEPVVILVLTSPSYGGTAEGREQEAVDSANSIGAEARFLRYAAGHLRQDPATVQGVRDEVDRTTPRLVFAPSLQDSHQDHRSAHRIVAASSTHVPEVLLYETPSTLGFTPQVFYDVTTTMDRKREALKRFVSQASRPYMNWELVEGQARYWALRQRAVGRSLEGFAVLRALR